MSNSLAVGGVNPYASLEECALLVRTITNDTMPGLTNTVGEGQIVIDNVALDIKLITSLNEAIREVYRELRTVGAPVLIADNYIVGNLPVVYGTQGRGNPDPATQVALQYSGFFDGTQMHSGYTLPINMLMPLRVWQRATGTNLPFVELGQAQDGLTSGYQNYGLGQWEWRSDGLWMNGSIYNYDIRIRYQLKLPLFYGQNIDFSQTYIPIQDCVSAVAYKAAYIIAFSLGSPQATELKARADQEMFHLRNENVRRAQGVVYHRPGYQENCGTRRSN
jgi:hypothetical protein